MFGKIVFEIGNFGFSVVSIVLLAFAALLLILIIRRYKRPRKTLYRTTINLAKITEIQELQMATYPYSGVVEKKKNGKPCYYVCYRGSVTLGSKGGIPKPIIDEKNKTITVSIPEPEILNTEIDFNSLDYIYASEKDNNDILQESYDLCCKDIEDKTRLGDEMLQNAKENTRNVIEGLLLQTIGKEYKIIID